jgi:hypothetical protein
MRLIHQNYFHATDPLFPPGVSRWFTLSPQIHVSID